MAILAIFCLVTLERSWSSKKQTDRSYFIDLALAFGTNGLSMSLAVGGCLRHTSLVYGESENGAHR